MPSQKEQPKHISKPNQRQNQYEPKRRILSYFQDQFFLSQLRFSLAFLLSFRRAFSLLLKEEDFALVIVVVDVSFMFYVCWEWLRDCCKKEKSALDKQLDDEENENLNEENKN